MNLQRIAEAAEALGWLADQADTVAADPFGKRTKLVSALVAVRSILLEYGDLSAKGMTPVEAIDSISDTPDDDQFDPSQDA